MKKRVVLVLFCLFLTGISRADWRILVRLEGSMKVPAGDDYKTVYGKQAYFPQVKLGVRLIDGLGLWISYGMLQKNGKTIEMGSPAKMQENIFQAGLGYWGKINKSFGFIVEAGYVYDRYTEEALEKKESHNASGFAGEGGFLIHFNDTFGLILTGGYKQAKEKEVGKMYDLSGIIASVGLQLHF